MSEKTGKEFKRNNQVARRHGGYCSRFDGRTKEARLIRHVQAELATALGGEPSPQQILLIQRASVKALRCALLEKLILSKNGDAAKSALESYLTWARELRNDLLALGLERKAHEITPTLQEYLREKYGSQ